MTEPTQVKQSEPHKLQSIPKDSPLERSGRKGWLIAGSIVAVLVVTSGIGMKSRRAEVEEIRFDRLEKQIIEDRHRLDNYDDVREFVRAKRENRRPELNPDQYDAAKETAEQLVKRYNIAINFER